MSGTHQNITRRKLAEEQLAQAQKIESVGNLAGGIAHDLNNMLAPILGYSELISQDMPEGDSRRKDLQKIITAAKHSRDLVHQLLAFARRQTLDMKNLDLNRAIEKIELMLRRTLRENIKIALELAPDIPEVRGDTVQIEQIIINLVVNAQDAMPDGGRLTIGNHTRRIDADESSRLDAVTPGHYVVLTVSDTGVGMDRETRKHIFEPFFTTKDLGKGTGLGLATVYGIVKQHDAFLSVYSEPGAGTVFKIYFAVQTEKQVAVEQQELPDATLSQTGTETILLVEDQVEVRELCFRFLAKAGYQVLSADSATEAINVLDRHSGPIHLLLTDVVLTDSNGKALHEQISSMREGIRVLFMSGYTTDVISHHGVLDEGMNFIHKPFSGRALREKVRQVLGEAV